jgi:hypothetical protein
MVDVVEAQASQKSSIVKVIGNNLSIFAPLSIVSAAAVTYCLAKMPVISIVVAAGVFYLTGTYQKPIKSFYKELTRKKKKNQDEINN